LFLLNQIVEGLERTDPGVPAFIDLDGNEVSFPGFASAVRRVAAGIARLAPGYGATVGILALNSRRYVELLLGAAWAGRIAVPLNFRWSPNELAQAVEDAAIEVLFVDGALIPQLDQLRALTGRLRHVVCIDGPRGPACTAEYAALLEMAPIAAAPAATDTTAAVIYTGGTTGISKGAMHTQGSLLASALNFLCMNSIPAGSRCLVSLPLFHSGAIGITFAQLLQRSTTVMAPMFRPDLVLRAVARLQADAMTLVPTMLGMLLDAPGFQPDDYRRVRAIAYGASPMPTALLHRVLSAFPQAALTQVYGMTEVGLAVMLTDRLHRGPEAKITSAGQAGPLYRVAIVDQEGRELPNDRLGEVVFRGPGVMKGYLNRPEATAEVLRDGAMYSGDAGVLDDQGVLTLMDRVKDMIVTGGENVYSAEVENAVSTHPSVAQCAVIAVPDETYGERVHAVVVLKEGTTLTLEDLRQHCACLIAGYKCPRSMETRDTLPLSAMGKVLKATLRNPHWVGQSRRVN
jgi:acyl-CoA synthetase (AMP-forming)/AMP-acid ligase II